MKHLNYLITIIILSISCLALPTWAATQTPMLIITAKDGKKLCSAPLDNKNELDNCPPITSDMKINVRMMTTPSDKKLKAVTPEEACVNDCRYIFYRDGVSASVSVSDVEKFCSSKCVPPPAH